MKTGMNQDVIQPIPFLGTRGLSMLSLSVWFLTSAVLSGIIGLLFSAGTRRDTDDAEQTEYLSRWSDLKRLHKQR